MSGALAHAAVPTAGAWVAWAAALAPAIAAAALYARGARSRASAPGEGGRGAFAAAGAPWFALGLVALAAAVAPPLEAAAERSLAVHMLQHEMLLAIAAPLLALARPAGPILRGLPDGWRRAFVRRARDAPGVRAALAPNPIFAALLQGAAIWLWHVPAAFEAATADPLWHALQHASFFLTGLVFWHSVVAGGRQVRRGVAVLALFLTTLHSGVLGALLALSSRPWYAGAGGGSGLTALEDQQIAGLVMWVPGGLVYTAAALALVGGWLARPARVALLVLGCAAGVMACDGAALERDAALRTGGSPARGRLAIERFGCGACHTIPGIEGARGLVGPPLGGIANRVYIAGVLPNTPDNVIRWIRDPQAVDSLTAMPTLGVGEREARDITGYLYTLR